MLNPPQGEAKREGIGAVWLAQCAVSEEAVSATAAAWAK